jgi:mono/diheme cytochrome c family protein
MKIRYVILLLLAIGLGSTSYWLFGLPTLADREIPQSADARARGEYLVTAGGCLSCHRGQRSEDDQSLSGGLALTTEFGTFYAPNITPDVETGIGQWTARDFLLALKHGRSPDGSFYYPAFPYRSYAGLTDRDVLAMAAYLMSLEPISNQVPEADTPFWLSRWAVAGWNRLADWSQPEVEDFDDEQIARGAYLARNLGHCGECHTPRNALGIPDLTREFAGATLGEEVIEPIDAEALAEWTFENFDLFLLLGMKPDADFVGGDMNEVIEYNTSKLTDADRDALAAFFTRHRTAD